MNAGFIAVRAVGRELDLAVLDECVLGCDIIPCGHRVLRSGSSNDVKKEERTRGVCLR